jgi:hypothetical protein
MVPVNPGALRQCLEPGDQLLTQQKIGSPFLKQGIQVSEERHPMVGGLGDFDSMAHEGGQ